MNFQFTTSDLAFITLFLSSAITVACIVFLSRRVALTLEKVNKLIEHVDDTARDVKAVKDQVKYGFFQLINTVLGRISRR